MRNLAILAVVVVLGLVIAYFLRARTHRGPATKAKTYETYLGLRNSALHLSRAEIGIPPAPSPDEPWGVMMDWGMDDGAATVVAFSDGNASVYLSSGGGFIGGGQSDEAVRKAAKDMVAVAAECRSQTHPTKVYPLPKNGDVSFYLLTDKGVFSASATVKDLMSHSHPLSRLGDAAQNVITQYRRARP